jgi:hypothetical protein
MDGSMSSSKSVDKKGLVESIKNAFVSSNKDLRKKCRDAKNNFNESSKSYIVQEKLNKTNH